MHNRLEIVAVARELLDTPFKHQGRTPGVGLDCAGVLQQVGARLEFIPRGFDFTAYDTYPDPTIARSMLARFTDVVAGGLKNALLGDFLLIADAGRPVHLGVLAAKNGYWTVIHASMRDGAVVEHILDKAFSRLVRGVYRARGVV